LRLCEVVARKSKKLHAEQNDLHFLHNKSVINSRMKQVGHVMAKRNADFRLGSHQETNHLHDFGIDGRIILKCICLRT